MSENISHSVTAWIEKLTSPDAPDYEQAVARIWERYSPQLLALARQNLASKIRKREDEDDVVQAVYQTFCLRQRQGEFDLKNRDQLIGLLVQITKRKVYNVAKKNTRQKRDAGAEIQENTVDGLAGGPLSFAADASPSPQEAAIFSEECELRLRALKPELRQIALWKLAGHTNEEIAAPDKMNCAVRTVERKLNLIRDAWSKD